MFFAVLLRFEIVQSTGRRDVNETFSFKTEMYESLFETKPPQIFPRQRWDRNLQFWLRDRDFFQDVANGTVC